MRDIRPLIAPRSIAVIGASSNPSKSGGVLFHNLIQGGFKGPLYPINPKSPEIMSKKSYASLRDVPEQVDLVYIVLPRNWVESAIQQCIDARARAACIITAGFSEVDVAGSQDETRLRDMAQTAGLLLSGPNTIGMVNTECAMMGSFVNFPRWESGNISLFTQTGIFTGALMLQVMSSDVQRLPVSKSIDVGNKIDVDEIDFLRFAAADAGTKVIGLYVESIRKPREFLELASEVRQKKPIVILKPGRTAEGKRASASHTGSLASDDAVLDAGLRQYGIVRCEDEDDFIGTLRALSMLPRAAGRRLGIATTSGALGVISTDLMVDAGLKMATFSAETLADLQKILPDWLEPANPFDFWISVDVAGPRVAHEVGLEAVFRDPNVDVVLCTLLAPANADFPEFGALMRRLRQTYDKPVALVIYGGSAKTRWVAELEGANIPVFPTTRAAARALSALVQATDPAADR